MWAEFDPAFRAGDTTMNARRGARGRAQTDSGGRFAIRGLGLGPFVVSVEAASTAGRTDRAAPRETFRAQRDRVEPGTEGLELVLHPPLGLAGRVVDRSGAPVSSFTVHAARIVQGVLGDMSLTRERRLFHDEDGRFVFEDLLEGTWRVYATATARVTSESLTLQLPAALAHGPIEIVMDAAGTISGRVVYAGGRHAPGAQVRVERGLPARSRPHRRGLRPPGQPRRG